MMTFDEFATEAELTFTCEKQGSNPNMTDMPQGSTHWLCTLSRSDKSMAVPFSMGPAHTSPPTLSGVLECLRMDSSATDTDSFEEWADDLGYDSDSRKAERIYNTCVQQGAELKALLGEGLFGLFLSEVEED